MYIQNFNSFNESRLSNIIGGSLIVLNSLGNPVEAKAMDDSLKIVATKEMVSVSKKDNDTMKFNLFLFKKDGEMVRSQISSNIMIISNLDSGSYFLEISDEENKKHYRFAVKVERWDSI